MSANDVYRKIMECADPSSCNHLQCNNCCNKCNHLSRSQRKAAARCASHIYKYSSSQLRRKVLLDAAQIKCSNINQRVPSTGTHENKIPPPGAMQASPTYLTAARERISNSLMEPEDSITDFRNICCPQCLKIGLEALDKNILAQLGLDTYEKDIKLGLHFVDPLFDNCKLNLERPTDFQSMDLGANQFCNNHRNSPQDNVDCLETTFIDDEDEEYVIEDDSDDYEDLPEIMEVTSTSTRPSLQALALASMFAKKHYIRRFKKFARTRMFTNSGKFVKKMETGAGRLNIEVLFEGRISDVKSAEDKITYDACQKDNGVIDIDSSKSTSDTEVRLTAFSPFSTIFIAD